MLLGFAVFINYVDRGNLATAGPVFTRELHLSATQFGILASAFYWIYAPTQLLTGWLAELGLPALSGLDTRSLTLHLREHGALRAALVADGTPSSRRSSAACWPCSSDSCCSRPCTR